MKDTRIAFSRPPRALYVALGLLLACTDEPTKPQDLTAPEFSKVAITDPTRVLTVGVDAPANLALTGTVAGIVVVVDNAIVDLSKATVDCSGQTGTDEPRIGVWIKTNRTNVHVKGGGTGVIKNCDTGVLIGPSDPKTGGPGGLANHVDGLVIQDCGWRIMVANSHDNLINANTLSGVYNGLLILGNDPSASASGRNKIFDNIVEVGTYGIFVSSNANTIRHNFIRDATDAAIAVDQDANIIAENQVALEPPDYPFGPPFVGIKVLSGADDNAITNNDVRAGEAGILLETNTSHNVISGNTAIGFGGFSNVLGAVDQSGNCVNNSWTKNTFLLTDPHCILALTLDAVTFTSPTTIQLEGPGATFNFTVTNQATTVADISVRSWIEQGLGLQRRLGGILPLRCSGAVGRLPRGTCGQVGGRVVASNASAGAGTLAVGGARAIIELVRVLDGDSGVVDSRSVPVTLTAPAAGSFWEIRAPLPAGQAGVAVGVVNNILYAMGGGGAAVAGYEPASNTWTAKAPMPTPRADLGVGVVGGVLYAVGGSPPYWPYLTGVVETYDAATNAWTTRAPMPTPRFGLGVGVINGMLYVVGGGLSDGSSTGAAEAYDPASNTWTAKASMPTPRSGVGVGVVNGVLYAVGGRLSDGSITGAVEAYDPVSNSWTARAPMPTPRFAVGVGVINGVLYAVGGSTASWPAPTVALEGYDPVTDSWTVQLPMPTPRYRLGVGVVNGILYNVGGWGVVRNEYGGTSGGAVDLVEAYHP